MMKYPLLLISIWMILLSSPPSVASENLLSAHLRPYEAEIAQVKSYLKSFKTMEARFSQVTPGNSAQLQGEIHLSRPGKLRIEYTSPDRNFLIVDDRDVVHYDYGLDQLTHGSLPNTPVDMLMYEDVELEEQFEILDVKTRYNHIAITLRPKHLDSDLEKEFVRMVMHFKMQPMELVRITSTNAHNHSSTMQLLTPKFNEPIDESVFEFKNPRYEDRINRKRN